MLPATLLEHGDVGIMLNGACRKLILYSKGPERNVHSKILKEAKKEKSEQNK